MELIHGDGNPCGVCPDYMGEDAPYFCAHNEANCDLADAALVSGLRTLLDNGARDVEITEYVVNALTVKEG